MRKIEHLDKYVVLPNVRFCGGFIYDGKDIFLCEDHDEDEDYDFRVKQEIKNNYLITDIKREYTTAKDKKVKEASHLEVEIEQGQLLVYVEGTGYTLPELKMCKVEEAINQFNILRGEKNDTIRNEKESTTTD